MSYQPSQPTKLFNMSNGLVWRANTVYAPVARGLDCCVLLGMQATATRHMHRLPPGWAGFGGHVQEQGASVGRLLRKLAARAWGLRGARQTGLETTSIPQGETRTWAWCEAIPVEQCFKPSSPERFEDKRRNARAANEKRRHLHRPLVGPYAEVHTYRSALLLPYKCIMSSSILPTGAKSKYIFETRSRSSVTDLEITVFLPR